MIRIYIYIYIDYEKLEDYLIGGSSYDADGKGEDEGESSCEKKAPPWHLDLLFQEDTECKGDSDSHN